MSYDVHDWLRRLDGLVDYILMGEGEISFKKLLQHLHGEILLEEVPGVCYLEDGKVKIHAAAPKADLRTMPSIYRFDEVESVLLMSGGYDLQLVIKGQTFQEIALFVAKRLSPLDDVLSTATHFVLRTYKKEGRLYQDEEIDERECTVL